MLYSHIIWVESVLQQGECPVTSPVPCTSFHNNIKKSYHKHYKNSYNGASPLGHLDTMDNSIQGHKNWSWENVQLIFVSVTSTEGTPLFRGKGHFFWIAKPKFNLH